MNPLLLQHILEFKSNQKPVQKPSNKLIGGLRATDVQSHSILPQSHQDISTLNKPSKNVNRNNTDLPHENEELNQESLFNIASHSEFILSYATINGLITRYWIVMAILICFGVVTNISSWGVVDSFMALLMSTCSFVMFYTMMINAGPDIFCNTDNDKSKWSAYQALLKTCKRVRIYNRMWSFPEMIKLLEIRRDFHIYLPKTHQMRVQIDNFVDRLCDKQNKVYLRTMTQNQYRYAVNKVLKHIEKDIQAGLFKCEWQNIQALHDRILLAKSYGLDVEHVRQFIGVHHD